MIEQAEYQWDYLCDSDDVFQECVVKILPQSSTTKKIVIEIKISTGAILVSGNNYQDWIKEVFEYWHNLVKTDVNTIPPTLPPPPTRKIRNDDDDETQMSQLWEEQTKLKTSITTLGSSVNELRNDLQRLSETIASHNSAHQEQIKERDDTWDKKLVSFLESAEETSKVLINRCKLELMDDFEKQRKMIIDQEARLQSSFDKLKNTARIDNTSQDPQKTLPKWTDLEHVSNCCRQANETAKNEIASMKETLIANNEKFEIQLRDSVHSLPKWTDLEHASNYCRQANETAKSEIVSMKETLIETNEKLDLRLRDSVHLVAPKATPPGGPPVEDNSGKKKIVILTDSNGKRLDKKKFCHPVPLNEITWQICYTLKQINEELNSLRDVGFDMIVICCGTNDTDERTGVEVANELIGIVHRIKQEHPHTKIVLSETTPRQHHRDQEIQQCNQVLHEHLDQMPGLSIAIQSGLREGNWVLYEDDKHIKRNRINVYAGNIKTAMREARTGRKGQSNSPNKSAASSNLTSSASYTQSNHIISNVNKNINNHHHHRNNNDNNYNNNNNNNNQNAHHMAPPLMSCSIASAGSHHNISNNPYPHPPPPLKISNNNLYPRLPPPNYPAPQPFPTTQTTWRSATPVGILPIGDRLTNIAENRSQSGQVPNQFKDTLIDKLGDVIKCLREW